MTKDDQVMVECPRCVKDQSVFCLLCGMCPHDLMDDPSRVVPMPLAVAYELLPGEGLKKSDFAQLRRDHGYLPEDMINDG